MGFLARPFGFDVCCVRSFGFEVSGQAIRVWGLGLGLSVLGFLLGLSVLVFLVRPFGFGVWG